MLLLLQYNEMKVKVLTKIGTVRQTDRQTKPSSEMCDAHTSKNAHVPTMLAQDNGVITDFQSQVGNSQTSFNPDISQLNGVQTIKLNFTNSINYTKVLFSGGRGVRRY